MLYFKPAFDRIIVRISFKNGRDIMNIPNILTAVRLLLVPAFFIVFFSPIRDATFFALLIFLFAGLTDILDGYIARKYNMVTKWGSILDPLADKLMSISVLTALTIKSIIPAWILIVLGIKELLMISGAAILYKKGAYVPAQIYGKVATVLFYISVLALEFLPRFWGLLFVYCAVISALFALYKYFNNFRYMNKIKKR